ncbi:zinc finger protein 878-like [Maniola hyperantus]|uniref:zinc finger protein 878-like n=1 Tax=Aphantopus hyperantus TaxID=2795564 RepID=UPI001569A928|nr:zinc finger protein 37-like [Maniola hyperantus]
MDDLISNSDMIAEQNSATSLPAQFCMICLDTSKDCKLYPVDKYNLDMEFEHLTRISLQHKMQFLPQFCTECAQRLSNCGKFRDKSLRAYHLLLGLLDTHKPLTIQTINTIDRINNQLVSKIDKKVYQPNHCDLHLKDIKGNNNTKDIHVKDEENDLVSENADALNCDIKCEVELLKKDIDDIVFLKNDFDNDVVMDDDNGKEEVNNEDKDSDVELLRDDDNDFHSYVNILNETTNNEANNKNSTNSRKVINNQRVAKNKDVIHNDGKVSQSNVLAKSKTQNNVRGTNTRKIVKTKVKDEDDNEETVIMDDGEISIKSERITKSTRNSTKKVTRRGVPVNNRRNLAKLKTQDRSKNNLSNVRDRTKKIKSESQISVKRKPVKRVSSDESNTRKVVVKRVKKKRVYIPTGNPPGPKPGFKSELKLFETTELSQEEQIAEVQARKETERFRNALFKCTICYKGFRDVDAYNGHLDRHTDKYGPFQCALCHLHSKNKHALSNHIANNHNYIYRCKECEFVTKHRHVASNHERWHDGKTYKCPHCDEQFMKSTSVMSHVRIKHPSDFVCTQCGFSFIGERGLNLHMSKKHRLEDTQNLTGPLCEPCNIRFASDTAYNQHMEVSPKHAPASKLKPNCPIQKYAWHLMKKNKEGEMSIDCEQCGVHLSNARAYTVHFRKHHPDKNRTQFPKAKVMCEQCGKVFKCMTELKYHMPLHADKKQFTCEICNKSFGRILNLKIHLRTHSDTRPKYECTVCGKMYLNLWGKMRHMRSHQDTRPLYTCDVCEKTFTSPQGRDSHVLHVHNNVPRPKRIRGPRSTPRQHARYTSDSQDS